MSDKDFKIGISTHADTSGANKAQQSVDKLSKATEENTDAVNPMREGWEEYVKAQEKAKGATDQTTRSIKNQTQASREEIAALTQKLASLKAQHAQIVKNQEQAKADFQQALAANNPQEVERLRAVRKSLGSQSRKLQKEIEDVVEQRQRETDASEKLVKYGEEQLELTKKLKGELEDVTALKEKAAAATEREAAAENRGNGGTARFARLKRFGARVKSLGVKGIKLAGIFTAVWKVFEWTGRWAQKTGKSMQSFGKDLELVGDAGERGYGKLIQTGGRWLEKAGNFLNFYGRYKEAVRYAAEEKRKLNKSIREEHIRLSQLGSTYDETKNKMSDLVDQTVRYNDGVYEKEKAQHKYNDALAEGNRLLERQRELTNAENDRSDAALDANERLEIAQLEAKGLSPEEESIRRKEIKEKFARKRFDLEQKRIDDELAFIEKDIVNKKGLIEQNDTERKRLTNNGRSNQVLESGLRDKLLTLIEQLEKNFTETLAKRNLASQQGRGKDAEALTDELHTIEESIKIYKSRIARSDKRLAETGFQDGDAYHAEVKRINKQNAELRQDIDDLGHEMKLIKFRDKTEELEEKSRRSTQSIRDNTFKKEQLHKAQSKAKREHDDEARSIVNEAEGISSDLKLPERFVNGINTLEANLKDGANDQEKKLMMKMLVGLMNYAERQHGRQSSIVAELHNLNNRFKTLNNQSTRKR